MRVSCSTILPKEMCDFTPQARGYVAVVMFNHTLQTGFRRLIMGNCQGCCCHRGRSAQTGVTTDEGWYPHPDQGGERTDGQVEKSLVVPNAIE